METETLTVDPVSAKEQQYRDLTNQLTGIDSEIRGGEQPEVVLRETSPRSRKRLVYSMVDGEPLRIPEKLLRQTLAKTIRGTNKPMFTAYPADAPTYKLGEVLCFLHPEANERPILNEIGMADKICHSGHLASGYARRMHGLHRHKEEWAAYQEYREEEKERVQNDRADAQLNATLELARAAAGTPAKKSSATSD